MSEELIPEFQRKRAPHSGMPMTPEEREATIRELLPAELRQAAETELAARRPLTAGTILLFCFFLALTAAAMLLTFPRERFSRKLTTPEFAGEERVDDGYRERLEAAIAARDAGEFRKYAALLLQPGREILASRSPEKARANERQLELYFNYYRGNPRKLLAETGKLLAFDPDSLLGRTARAGAFLPGTEFAALLVTPKEELKERSAQAAALVQPLADLTGLRPAMRNRVTRLLALSLAGEWIAAGCKDDPGEPGFDERERALALCRRYPADRELVRLRHDILQHIWSFPWFWRTQVVEGRRITAGELKREFSELQTLLERGEP